MDWDFIGRVFTCLLAIPLIGAAASYWLGRRSGAMIWNGSVPVLVLGYIEIWMLTIGGAWTVAGLPFVIPPAAGLAASALGYFLHSQRPLLFWFPWCLNLAIVAFLSYMAFWFRVRLS
jgi:hypothetical protein